MLHGKHLKLHFCWLTLKQWLLLALLNKLCYNCYAGAGLYVYNGESSGDLGSLPNNGVVISLVTARFGFYFRFFFRSDSMMRNVGMLIGPDGTTVTTGDIFKITHPRPGAMRVDNTLSQNIPTASDQGVYTCRIPLQSGEIRSINVGIYPSGFSSKCLFFYTEHYGVLM